MQTGNPRIDSSSAALIVASDEVGYGAWAGPLLVVAVCVPRDWKPPTGLTDSKKLSESSRRALVQVLLRDPDLRDWSVFIQPKQIDEVGVYRANIAAHQAAHRHLSHDQLLSCLHVADGNLDLGPDIVSLPKADALVPAVSAASVIAKHARDLLMTSVDEKYPGYGFAGHKGYGVPVHQEALSRLGPCEIHRMSYGPVKAAVKQAQEPAAGWGDLFDGMDME